jgi:hypothetical protein
MKLLMTTSPARPLLLQFSQRIETPSLPDIRLDHTRQLMQVRVGDIWVDAIDAPTVPRETRTDVKHESTDEE